MKSLIAKRSIVIAGHKTSISLEDSFWKDLREIAHARGETLSRLVSSINADRENANCHQPFASLCSASIVISVPIISAERQSRWFGLAC